MWDAANSFGVSSLRADKAQRGASARPLAIDLFCGAGGVTKGLQRAGFFVVGVDLKPQPRYCGDLFIQGDATNPPLDLAQADFIWASPPCQAYSWAARRWHDIERADLVEPTRDLLRASGVPYVIENVVGAPLHNPITLCGAMFGLQVIRHRLFEASFFLIEPTHVPHRGSVKGGQYVTVAGHGGDNIKGRGGRAAKQAAMGIDWMSDDELNQAIPPAYSEYIGRAAIAQLQAQRVAA